MSCKYETEISGYGTDTFISSGFVEGNYIQSGSIRVPKVVARVKLCGGALTFNFYDTDTVPFEMPTEEQCENLKKTFGIEVEWVNEEISNNNLVDGKLSTHHIDYVDGEIKIIND